MRVMRTPQQNDGKTEENNAFKLQCLWWWWWLMVSAKKALPWNSIAIKKQTTCLHPLHFKRVLYSVFARSTITGSFGCLLHSSSIVAQRSSFFLVFFLYSLHFCLHLHHVIISLSGFVVTTNTSFNRPVYTVQFSMPINYMHIGNAKVDGSKIVKRKSSKLFSSYS